MSIASSAVVTDVVFSRNCFTTPGPSLVPPEPRKGPQKVAPTPEQIAKVVTAKRPSPVGQPAKVELTLRLVLPRDVAERLTARAIRETRKLEALIQEILEGAAK